MREWSFLKKIILRDRGIFHLRYCCHFHSFPQRQLLILSLLSWSWFLSTSVAAQQATNQEQRRSEAIQSGLEHLEIKRGDFGTEIGERWWIQALIVDPQKFQIQLGRAMDEIVGAETTSSLVMRHNAIAGINAGYFRVGGTYRGEPMGTLILNGKILSESNNHRPSLAISNANRQIQVALSKIEIDAELIIDGKNSITVNGYNRPREKDEIIIFTPEFHRTTLTDPEGIEIIVRRHRVQKIIQNRGSQMIPPDGFIISATGKGQALLASWRRGMKVDLREKWRAEPQIKFSPEFIIGGGPRLLQNGQVSIDEEGFNAPNFTYARHPRTAFGVRKDGAIVMVTVDGRQPKKSVGMTIPELTKLMLELGCIEAFNLDGGGSTTMVIKNKIINNVSDATGERPVSDALLIIPR